MSTGVDPSVWQQIAEWLWAALLFPLAYVWRRATGAVEKDELRDHLTEDRRIHDEFKETLRTLFENAEKDRNNLHEQVSTLRNEIHSIHIDLIEKIKR